MSAKLLWLGATILLSAPVIFKALALPAVTAFEIAGAIIMIVGCAMFLADR